MIRAWLAVAALLGLCGVGAGAVGAHAVTDPFLASLMATGSNFALPHAAALLGLAALSVACPPVTLAGRVLLAVGGWLLAGGTVLFSGGLWLHGLSGRSPGPIAPAGGTLLLIGWLVLLCVLPFLARQRPAA